MCSIESVKEKGRSPGEGGVRTNHLRDSSDSNRVSKDGLSSESQALTPEQRLAASLECLLHTALLERLLHAACVTQTDLRHHSCGTNKETPKIANRKVPGSLGRFQELTVR